MITLKNSMKVAYSFSNGSGKCINPITSLSYKKTLEKKITKPIDFLNQHDVAFTSKNDINKKVPVVFLHGWTDNLATFNKLIPEIHRSGRPCFALDLPGHGFTDRIGPFAHYNLGLFSSTLNMTLNTLGFTTGQELSPLKPSEHLTYLDSEKIDIVSHSMGSAVALLYAAAFPEKVRKIVMLENNGPFTSDADYDSKSNSAQLLKRTFEQEDKYYTKLKSKKTKKDDGEVISNIAATQNIDREEIYEKLNKHEFDSARRVYDTVKEALDARKEAASFYPGGNQFISEEGVLNILSRGLITNDKDFVLDPENLTPGPVQFLHDQRLMLPFYYNFKVEDIKLFFQSLKSDVMFIYGKNGWPQEILNPSVQERINLIESKNNNKANVLTLPGSHHLHLDSDSFKLVSEKIIDFLNEN